ncbi:hypothetical protein IMCC3317_34420 [Kordia antarctica]|uniref:Holliday junction resolvase RuvC n=1 Tax=Kordia antarctica TaxID=1218801 RepID=A0A7L4ZMW1_9FLAO|nr:hypothetical protein [Kordia antarctica]QHI38058.1 hypothetical protein IMCC3317_34420 [Kordia antarctica]
MSQISNYTTGLTIAIFPNGIGFGYAVMKDALSVEMANVVAIKPRPVLNDKTLEKIREKIAYYEPSTMVIEDPIKASKSKRVAKLLKQLTVLAKERNIKVYTYTRSDIRFVFSNFKAHTKHEIAQVITKQVPYMKNRMMEKRRCFEGEAFITGAFDSIALGITHFYLID